MAYGPPKIARDQVDDRTDGGSEAQDAQLKIHEDRADAGARDQVGHVVVGS